MKRQKKYQEKPCESTVIRKYSDLRQERLARHELAQSMRKPYEMNKVYDDPIEGPIIISPIKNLKGFSIDTKGYSGTHDLNPYIPEDESGEEVPEIVNHRLLVTPDLDDDGEGTLGAGKHDDNLAGLDKMIYRESVSAGGVPAIEHINRGRRQWFKYAAGIKERFGCEAPAAEALCDAFKTLDTTATMARKFEAWIKSSPIETAVEWFVKLANELTDLEAKDDALDQATGCYEFAIVKSDPFSVGNLTYPQPNPEAFDQGICRLVSGYVDNPEDGMNTEAIIEEDEPQEEKYPMLSATAYHLLDDPRDLETPWLERQNKNYQRLTSRIRVTRTIQQLQACGTEIRDLHDRLSKVQVKILWSEYRSAKQRITKRFAIRPKAKKTIARIKEAPKTTVSSWLKSKACDFNPAELTEAWDEWRRVNP